MGSDLCRALLTGAPLSVPTGYTHAPGPGGMPTSYNWYLPPWPLCTVCAKKGVDNLLNRTLPAAEQVVVRKQAWGLLEQDSIYGRLRRLMSSLHDMYIKYISTDEITTHYTLLCHTGHNRPDGDRRQAHSYPRHRLSRIPFRHECKAHEDAYHHKYIHFQQQGNH